MRAVHRALPLPIFSWSNVMRFSSTLLISCALAVASAGALAADMAPIKPVDKVELQRFMGPWYVIASIPSALEKKAYNAVETYTLAPNGHIDTVFRYRNSAFTNPIKTINSTGFVKPNTNNAVWGVQIIWPIKAQYVIAYLDDNYSETIIARDKRDYVWIMARTPTIPQADYDAMVERVRKMGYTMSDLRKVPQQWPDKAN
jgi:apolipoprotein D and lipocalin family protein